MSRGDSAPPSSSRFRARVHVYPRREILDPQGRAIGDALARLGFDEVAEVRAGKGFEVELTASDEDAAVAQLERMCSELLANPITEDYSVELLGDSSR